MRPALVSNIFSLVGILGPTASYAQAPLDFTTFVTLVERQHPEAVIVQHNVLRSRQAEARAGVLADPDVGVVRQFVPLGGGSRSMDGGTTSPASQLTLTQTIPWPGTLAAEENTARASGAAIETDEKMAAVLRRLAAEEMFIDMVHLAEAANLAEASLADADSIIKSSTARLRNAVGSHHELIQAQNEKAVHKLTLAALQADLQNLQDHAAEILGRSSAAGLAFALRLPDTYSPAHRSPGPSISVDLTRQRRQQTEDAAAARLAAEHKRSLPHLTVAGMIMRQDDGMRSVGGMVGLSVPLFSGKVRSSIEGEHAASSSQTGLDLAWHERKKALALSQNRRRLQVLGETWTTLENEIVPNARDHLQAVLSDYGLGRAAFTAVSAARAQLLKLQVAAANARQAYARAVVAEERILAGFVDDALDQPTPQVLGSMNGLSGGEMGGPMAAPPGPASMQSKGEGPSFKQSDRDITRPPGDEPSATSGSMGGM